MIHVIAVITAKPGKRAEILAAFRANVPAVRAEKGCIEYGAAIDADNALPVQKKMGRGYVPRDREVGQHGRAQGARRRAAHGRLRREDARAHREPRDPHPLARVVGSVIDAIPWSARLNASLQRSPEEEMVQHGGSSGIPGHLSGYRA